MTTSSDIDNSITQDTYTTSIFKDKIIEAITEIRDARRRPDLEAIFSYVIKSEATNIDKDFVETLIVELINGKKIINKRTSSGLD